MCHADEGPREQRAEAEPGLRDREGPEEGLERAAARLTVAEQELRLIEVRLAKTEIRAPIDGTVLVKGVEPGEYVAPGQVVAVVVDMTQLELKVYIPERDIGKVTLGAPARVWVDAFTDRYFDGEVSKVDQEAQFTPKDVHLPEERTRMVFGVTLRVDNPGGYLKPGMPADAWIRWRDDVPWPDDLPVPQS